MNKETQTSRMEWIGFNKRGRKKAEKEQTGCLLRAVRVASCSHPAGRHVGEEEEGRRLPPPPPACWRARVIVLFFSCFAPSPFHGHHCPSYLIAH